jgi:hypothetical protein
VQAPDEDPDQTRFLRRSLQSAAAASGGGADDGAMVAVLDHMVVANGLECKISCTTCKVSYVLDTEDVMVRCAHRGRATSAPTASARAARFGTWLASACTRIGADGPPPGQAEAAAVAAAQAGEAAAMPTGAAADATLGGGGGQQAGGGDAAAPVDAAAAVAAAGGAAPMETDGVGGTGPGVWEGRATT